MAFNIFRHYGIVRDVPELNIYANGDGIIDPQDYNDSVTKLFDKDFPINKKKNILVLGDSFGRDWVNIILESNITKDSINISYRQSYDETAKQRIKKADIIFLANSLSYKFYDDLFPLISVQ